MSNSKTRTPGTETILRHWREAVPDDRLAHLVKDATRALVRSLGVRLAEHGVSFGHWSFLRILWEGDGITQRELSEQAGVMEPTTFSALKTMEKLGYVARRQLGNLTYYKEEARRAEESSGAACGGGQQRRGRRREARRHRHHPRGPARHHREHGAQ